MTEFRYSAWEDRSALTTLWQQAFGDETAFIDAFFETAYEPSRSRVAVEEGQIAGMLFWFDCGYRKEKMAYLYAVATDLQFRGKGIATALMKDCEQVLKEQGYDGVILSPGSPELFRFYRDRGYRTLGFRGEERIAAGDPISVREVGIEEYARIRRTLLPEKGIVQEGENLAFLHRFCRFFTGEGFCAVVYRTEAFLPEYLGDARRIPGLLATLGLKEASVRTAEANIPCAMAKWLKDRSPEDFYLGFVFD